ncbi:hypothetical protein [Streptomyces luteireticuli]
MPVLVLDGIAGLLDELERRAGERDEDTQQAAREAAEYLRSLTG